MLLGNMHLAGDNVLYKRYIELICKLTCNSQIIHVGDPTKEGTISISKITHYCRNWCRLKCNLEGFEEL